VKNGEPTRVEGDTENPIGRGKTCIKNSVALDFHRHPNRLNYPLKRAGERGEGKWKRTSWKDAVDEIAEKIRKIKK